MTCRKTTPLTMNLTSNLNLKCSTFGSQTLILLLNSFTLQRATATNCKPNESLHEDQPTWRGVADLPVQVQELFRCIKFSDPWHPFPSSDAGLDFHNNSRKCSMKVKFVSPSTVDSVLNLQSVPSSYYWWMPISKFGILVYWPWLHCPRQSETDLWSSSSLLQVMRILIGIWWIDWCKKISTRHILQLKRRKMTRRRSWIGI